MNKLTNAILVGLCFFEMASLPALKIELKSEDVFRPAKELPKPQFRFDTKLKLRPLFKETAEVQLRIA
jgi:hypothetical protein